MSSLSMDHIHAFFRHVYCVLLPVKKKKKKKKKEETGYSGIGKLSVAEMKN